MARSSRDSYGRFAPNAPRTRSRSKIPPTSTAEPGRQVVSLQHPTHAFVGNPEERSVDGSIIPDFPRSRKAAPPDFDRIVQASIEPCVSCPDGPWSGTGAPGFEIRETKTSVQRRQPHGETGCPGDRLGPRRHPQEPPGSRGMVSKFSVVLEVGERRRAMGPGVDVVVHFGRTKGH